MPDDQTGQPNPEFNLSDYLTGPVASIAIPALSAIAGASRRIPTRFGYRRAGLSGLVEGGLSGLGMVSEMQQQQRKLNEERRLSEIFGDKGYLSQKIPTGRMVPTGKAAEDQAAPPDVSEGLDIAYGGGGGETARAPTPELMPETIPMMSESRRKILAAMPPSVQSAALMHMLTQQEKPIPVGRGGLAIKDPSQPEGYRIIVAPPQASPFGKFPVPTTRDYLPGSIVNWRATVTPESPIGDPSFLLPRETKEPPAPPTGMVAIQQALSTVKDAKAQGQPVPKRYADAYGTTNHDDIIRRLEGTLASQKAYEREQKQTAMEIAAAGRSENLAPSNVAYYNNKTGQFVNSPTVGEVKANRQNIITMPHANADRLLFAKKMVNEADGLDKVVGFVLAHGGVGATLSQALQNVASRGVAGSNEALASYDFLRRSLAIEETRLLSNSSRPPQMMLKMIEGTLPGDRVSLEAARQELKLFKNSSQNVQNIILRNPNMEAPPIPDLSQVTGGGARTGGGNRYQNMSNEDLRKELLK